MWSKRIVYFLCERRKRAGIFSNNLSVQQMRCFNICRNLNLNIYNIFNVIQVSNTIIPKKVLPSITSGIKKTCTQERRDSFPFSNPDKICPQQIIPESSYISKFRVSPDKTGMEGFDKSRRMLFQLPKQTINNFFDILVHIFGNDMKLVPSLQMIQIDHGLSLWKCEYRIKWPEEKIFSHIHFTKKEASNGSALEALNYLYQKKVMNVKGKPILGRKIHSFNNIQISRNQSYCTRSSRDSFNTTASKKILSCNVDQNNEVEDLKPSKLFPNPKSTLSNIFQVVSNDKGKDQSWFSRSYKSSGKNWVCTYKLKWPEDISFSASGSTKQQASNKSALETLDYLLRNNRVTKKGIPILYDKEDIKALLNAHIPKLHLQRNQIEKLEKIVDLHTTKIFPILVDEMKTIENNISMDENEDLSSKYKMNFQKFLGYNVYKCKEKITLPVSEHRESIIKMVQENRVLIVKGEPGCGKSTRIPQYILEGWARTAEETGEPCNIVVTEPRRIAAISLADRVSYERDEDVGTIVGYKVRFKSNIQPRTGRILYCTNGILLQHLKSDPKLSNYTHVVIDEAHERDINTDLLLNILKRLLDENPALKVVIMSATIDTELFQNYFEGSALIHIPGFTYPVKSYFLDSCKLNLEKTYRMCSESTPSVIHEDVARVLMHLHSKKPEGAILCFLPGWEDIRKIRDLIPPQSDLNVLCLHSRLQDSDQWKIFRKSPPGVRKIILSTNIAETSVTVDDVVYVVDTGIHKETILDVEKGVMCIDNHWISRSSVEQRRGRAGRVRAGECFHLYPKIMLETLSPFSLPEVLRVSLTKVVLDSKVYSQDMSALEFFSKLPSPPSQDNVELAVGELKDLELIDDKEKMTHLGEVVSNFQLEPKLSKTLVNSVIYKCVSPIVDIVTLFSSGTEIFASSLDSRGQIRGLKENFSRTSDHLSMMRIFEIWEDFREHGNGSKMESFCADLRLIPARLKIMKSLKDLHIDYLRNGLHCRVLPLSDDFSDEDEMVKAVLLSGVGTFLSHKNWDVINGRLKKANILLTRLNHRATITPDSVNFKNTTPKSKFLLYINETRSNIRRTSLVRETSLIPSIMVLLFLNKKLQLQNIDKDRYSPEVQSTDQVILHLVGTKLNFLLDRQQALTIMQCKLALTSCYEHFIFQLTKGGEHNPDLNQLWDEVLTILNDFLNDFRNE